MKAAGIDRPDVGVAVAWDVAQIVVDAYRHLGVDATPPAIGSESSGNFDS